MVWVLDDSQFKTINLIVEGFATIISDTFPSTAKAGDNISGTITIRNDGDTDNFRMVVTRQDNLEVILDEIVNLLVGATTTSGTSTPFIMPSTNMNLLIETFHEE